MTIKGKLATYVDLSGQVPFNADGDPIDKPIVQSATIADGASLSGAIDLASGMLSGIALPSGFTGSSISFQVSTDDGSTFQNFYDDSGAEVVLSVSASRYIGISNWPLWAGVQKFKIRAGTNASASAQTGAQVLKVVGRS